MKYRLTELSDKADSSITTWTFLTNCITTAKHCLAAVTIQHAVTAQNTMHVPRVRVMSSGSRN